ncbi:hypothetical protein MPSEU_000453800 [Mayamaea pseudoterrestris]|nr:hypothetical protein MPSEU_000453800 [Mayamaea pseudoterrestris]
MGNDMTSEEHGAEESLKRKANEIAPDAAADDLTSTTLAADDFDDKGSQSKRSKLDNDEEVVTTEEVTERPVELNENDAVVTLEAHALPTQNETAVNEADASHADVTLAEEATTESFPSPSVEEPLVDDVNCNEYDKLRWAIVNNDGEQESMIKLIGLKSLFSKQLPKMPRPYIARLVLDRRHTSLAILSDNPEVKDSDDEIIGGICYRAFPEMRFAEIVFCAVSANHQVKGYGTKLMNLFKYKAAQTGIEYFITYADNYAIGYFKKQGFTKTITMPKGRYTGLIKEYDGGTPMECYIHPSINFTRINEMLDAQRDFILQHVNRHAKSRTVYEPLPKDFAPNVEGVSRANLVAAQAFVIPGIQEAGWTMSDLVEATGVVGKDTDRQKGAQRSDLLSIVRKVQEQQFAWPFREPVDIIAIPDYAEIIKEPMDLSTIEKRIRQDNYYKSKTMLLADLLLIAKNCKTYNDEASAYWQCAVSLEKFLGTVFADTPGINL